MHARFLKTGWTPALKLEMLQFYEDARAMAGGHSFAGYLENVCRDFFAEFTEEERRPILAGGAKWPSSALSVLAKLPEHPSPETITEIIRLDRQIKQQDSDAARKLRIGVVAVLGVSKDPAAMAYLREVFEAEPERRVPVAMGLAQAPDGENWPLLVRSLPIVEGTAAQEVLVKLAEVERSPEDAEPYRQVILRGLMLRDNGSQRAVELLERWTGERHSEPTDSWQTALAAWQSWFVDRYPTQPEPQLPIESEKNHWTQQELLSYLNGMHGAGDQARGSAVFEKATCIRCHRYGDRGDVVGPDLTTISSRFQKKEMLESILFPSQVISDQYASRVIVTRDGRTVIGMAAPTGDGRLTVLQANGERVVLTEEEIDSSTRSKKSAMPEGMLNSLSLEEVADLFAYLMKPPMSDAELRLSRRSNRQAAE
jgi:putative heme-binding domain-containing protein